jgi:hypothetical protein
MVGQAMSKRLYSTIYSHRVKAKSQRYRGYISSFPCLPMQKQDNNSALNWQHLFLDKGIG